MREEAARRLALIRAIETEDPSERILTRDDRLYATGAALAQVDAEAGERKVSREDRFLERRSTLAFERLAARYPAALQAERQARWPDWIDWLLPLAGLGLGIASNAVDGRRLSIIAFPMLGMVLWNLAIYVLLAVQTVRRVTPKQKIAPSHPLTVLIQRFAGPGRAAASAHQPLGGALARFVGDWLTWSAPLTTKRAARALHLSAAAVAIGFLIGMYLRALGTEYRAGWESTLLGPGTVHGLIHFLLWPASLVTNIELPNLAEVQALRWGAGGAGENAGRWLHLYAASALLFIIVPRLILAGWNEIRVSRLSTHFPIPGQDDFYVRRLLRSLRGDMTVVRLIPYSFNVPERTQRQLEAVLTDVLGQKTQMVKDSAIPYGAEDEWLEGLDLRQSDADHLILLFNLSATPEAENQGALVAGLRRRIAEARSGAGLTILLDESTMRQRLGPGSEGRIESRRGSWEAMLAQHHAVPLSLNLDAEPATLARPLEGALLHAHAKAPA